MNVPPPKVQLPPTVALEAPIFKVPADRVKILRETFDKTINDPALQAEAEKRRLEIDPTRWDEMDSLAKDVMASPPDVVARMRKLLGD